MYRCTNAWKYANFCLPLVADAKYASRHGLLYTPNIFTNTFIATIQFGFRLQISTTIFMQHVLDDCRTTSIDFGIIVDVLVVARTRLSFLWRNRTL